MPTALRNRSSPAPMRSWALRQVRHSWLVRDALKVVTRTQLSKQSGFSPMKSNQLYPTTSTGKFHVRGLRLLLPDPCLAPLISPMLQWFKAYRWCQYPHFPIDFVPSSPSRCSTRFNPNASTMCINPIITLWSRHLQAVGRQ